MSSGHARDAQPDEARYIEVLDLRKAIRERRYEQVGIPVRREGRNLVPLTGKEILSVADEAERFNVNLTYSPFDEGSRQRQGYVVTLSRM
jgi:hypothetical protein